MLRSILNRVREPSTHAGVAVLLGLFGVQVAPETMKTSIEVASGLAALAAIAMGERGR